MKKLIGKEHEISLCCSDCGTVANYLTCLEKFGDPPLKVSFDVSTYGMGTCGVCGRLKEVTQTRDFFYPNFTPLLKLLAKAKLKHL